MKFATLSAITLFLLIGCSSPGDLVLHQDADTPPKVSRVTTAGDYGLFVAGDAQPLLQFSLKQGDAIGFEKDTGGMVIWLRGIAGSTRTRLEIDKTYEWRKL